MIDVSKPDRCIFRLFAAISELAACATGEQDDLAPGQQGNPDGAEQSALGDGDGSRALSLMAVIQGQMTGRGR
ncbi:MAG: hypothetical protein ACU841_15865 [Gammaproteobacteria bacterium]